MAKTETHDVTIFHNPVCSKSRGALQILNERGTDYELIEYIVTPPSRETLEMILSMLKTPPSELIRTTDKQFVALGFDANAYQSREEVIDFLLVHPELMQRPVVIRGDKAIIARPEELVLGILD